jgi:hypothetical protein
MQNHEEIFQNSAAHISHILERNGIPGSDYRFTETQYDSYGFLIDFTYSFQVLQNTQTIAGGEGISLNHYTSGGYEATKSNYLRYASACQNEKDTFVRNARSNLISLFISNKNGEVWVAPTFSYSYSCSNCDGTGKVTCGSCNGHGTTHCYRCRGTGRVSEIRYFTDSNGNSQSENVYRSCYSCSGSGEETCHGCGGSGKRRCSKCGGHGYFTEYCYIKTIAKPSTTYGTEKGIYANEVVAHFLSMDHAHLCDVMRPEITGGTWLNNGDYRFSMKAPITVVENTVTARGKEFIEVAVNRLPGILYPPLFDHLLGKIQDQLLKAQALGLNRGHAMKLYHGIKNQYAMHQALLAYGESGDADKMQKIALARSRIFDATGGYISQGFSSSLSADIVTLMSRLAPHPTSWPWWLAGLPFLLLEMVLAARINYSTISPAYSLMWFNLISAPMIGVNLLFVLFMVPPVALFTWMFTRYRQRGIPAMHRPKVRQRKFIVKVIGALSIAWYLLLALLYLAKRFAHGAYLAFSRYVDPISRKIMHVAQTRMTDFLHSGVRTLTGENAHDWIQYLHGHAHQLKHSMIIAFLVVYALIYLLPTILAFFFRKRGKIPIFLLNLFLPPFLWVSWFLLLYLDFL